MRNGGELSFALN